MGRRKRSGVSVIERGDNSMMLRDEINASIKARYGIAPKGNDEYTVMEFAALTGRAYEAARDFLVARLADNTWERRPFGKGYLYREVVK